MTNEAVSLCDLVVSLAAPTFIDVGFKQRKSDLVLRTEETNFVLLFPRGRNRASSPGTVSFRIEANVRKLDTLYRNKDWKERLDLLDPFDASATYRELSGDHQHLGHWYLSTPSEAKTAASAISSCLNPVIGFIDRFSNRTNVQSELQARHRANSTSSVNLELRYLVYLHQTGEIANLERELSLLREQTQNNARAQSQIARMLAKLGYQPGST